MPFHVESLFRTAAKTSALRDGCQLQMIGEEKDLDSKCEIVTVLSGDQEKHFCNTATVRHLYSRTDFFLRGLFHTLREAAHKEAGI